MLRTSNIVQNSHICSTHVCCPWANLPELISPDIIRETASQPTLNTLTNLQSNPSDMSYLQEVNITLFFIWAIFVIVFLQGVGGVDTGRDQQLAQISAAELSGGGEGGHATNSSGQEPSEVARVGANQAVPRA